ncbi:hypothetical protein ACFX5Q_15160 [Mesorhizobium sp. IMUNJ 23033]|uniref:hypothetical protein n=1 Tax=Mesorhizobium sp. IMUNJ 23033 TaxID=3378039 RepID=UPI003850D001
MKAQTAFAGLIAITMVSHHAFAAGSHAFEDVPVLRQLLEVVGDKEQTNDTEFFGRIGIVSGNALIFDKRTYERGGPTKIAKFLDRCYAIAKNSGQMRNIMACFVADFELTSAMSRSLNSPTIADTTTNRFKNLFSVLGFDKNMQQKIYAQFKEVYIRASKWRETRTIAEISNCIKAGVGGLDCP